MTILLFVLGISGVFAENTYSQTAQVSLNQKIVVTGTVKDAISGEPIPGVNTIIQGISEGTITDLDGNFTLKVPSSTATLIFSFTGYVSQTVALKGKTKLEVLLVEAVRSLDEVVVVGYGTQKKASVVGAIATTNSKELERSGGVNNVAMALTGKLAGLTTIQTSGQPGNETPKLYIRGQGTWNGGEPLILVDGVERNMNDIDLSEVENISILKDASATAVYGVKGANGVILITSKRGAKGKSQLSISANSTAKWAGRLVRKLDSYDTYMLKNLAIEREVPLLESSWADYTPLAIAQRYRNQQSLKYPEAYPNVDWVKETIKPYTMDHRVNLNVAGGGDFAKYFSSLSYSNEEGIMKTIDEGRGYNPGHSYNKFNFRTNLDLNLTKSTTLKINMAGVYSRTQGYSSAVSMEYLQSAYYSLAPNAFLPRYADGSWGVSPNNNSRLKNSLAMLSSTGTSTNVATNLQSDIGITQKLDMITKGLSASANISFDNYFASSKAINDGYESWATKYIYPEIEDMPVGGNPNQYIITNTTTNTFPWVRAPWSLQDEQASSAVRRRLYYQAQLNYARTFGKHEVTSTGVFTREQWASGSEFQRYREDWVLRATYNYDGRYLAEFNGAYNGSEKFGPAYRFAFFPSGAVGWVISNEQFMKSTSGWMDKLKLRYSYGKIGDDGGLSQRWLYSSQWRYDGNLRFSQYNTGQGSPYTMYTEYTLGNEDIHWETAKKSNLGLEVVVLNNMFSGNFEYFNEDRTGILLLGSSRSLPPYLGTAAPTANVGRVSKKGYEIELRFNKNIKDVHLWADASMTHVVDKVMDKEEPELKDPQLLAKGFQIDQTKSVIGNGILQNWDQVYGTPSLSTSDNFRLPGNYSVIDFNSDGMIDGNTDTAPYAYSNRPQNSYNMSFGADYKGFSAMVQFYGVNNVTRSNVYTNFTVGTDVAYEPFLNNTWTKENPDVKYDAVRWKTSDGAGGTKSLWDGSYLRLKTAEVAYTFSGKRLKHFGLSSFKFYLNGNNLFFWSELPDDREAGDSFGVYPTTKRINLGVDIKF